MSFLSHPLSVGLEREMPAEGVGRVKGEEMSVFLSHPPSRIPPEKGETREKEERIPHPRYPYSTSLGLIFFSLNFIQSVHRRVWTRTDVCNASQERKKGSAPSAGYLGATRTLAFAGARPPKTLRAHREGVPFHHGPRAEGKQEERE